MKDKWIKAKEDLAQNNSSKKNTSDSDIQGSGPTNRHGMPKLPPEQREVTDWPVLDLGIRPKFTMQDWNLKITGEIEKDLEFNWTTFMELPQIEDVSDFHCVTSWSRMDNNWKGVRLKELLEMAVLKRNASHILFESYDDYTTNIPLEEALKDDVMLVHTWEGQPLPYSHGGPLRVITPQLWAWKGAKWIRHIKVLDHDEPGFWEVRGYSNTALPWKNDRYS